MSNTIQNLQEEIDKLGQQIEQNSSIEDVQLKEIALEENRSLKLQIDNLTKAIEQIEKGSQSKQDDSQNSPTNPNKAIVEIRAGTGGSEAALFAKDLYEMYAKFAQLKGWKIELLSKSEELMGGIKTISTQFSGKDAYTLLKNESGVHRVQRVPTTESQGRIHTSTATVAILPVVSPIQIEIKSDDVKEDFYRSGGKGGQNVNKVSTAVRITHIPTGLVVECQQERTQGRNREKAMEILRSRLFSIMQQKQVGDISKLRADQVGTGERSEKIRTYNFPQDRITDHRLKKSWGNIENVLNGELEKILQALKGLTFKA